MDVEIVDIYQSTGFQKEPGAVGRLTAWIQHTSRQVSARRRRPAVLILPGGAYGWTSEREAEPVALRFASFGYGAFVLEYSCAPFGFPTSLREAAMAMRYIRENAERFEIDPHMVAALGFSAGGHLCGCLGTLFDCPEVQDIAAPDQIRPDALVLCYPVTVSQGKTHEMSFENLSKGNAAVRERLSLERLVRSDMPPVFLWHTRDDGSVPVAGSLALAQAMEAAGVDFSMHVYHHGQHGLSTADAMAFPVDKLPSVSSDVSGWMGSATDFLTEIGFAIQDLEDRP